MKPVVPQSGFQSQLEGRPMAYPIVYRDSANVIKETSCKVFTGLTVGFLKVLSDPSGDPKWDEELVKNTATTASWNVDGTAIDTPSEPPAAEIRGKVEDLVTSECIIEPDTVDEYNT
jgi:hypothetical protein